MNDNNYKFLFFIVLSILIGILSIETIFITVNKTNKDRLVTYVYGETNTTDPEEIKNQKSKINDFKDYEVSLDYDDDGYVNEITITEMGSEFEGFDDFTSTMDDMMDF